MDKELSRHTARAKAAGESGVTGGGSLQVQAAEKRSEGDETMPCGRPGQGGRGSWAESKAQPRKCRKGYKADPR